MPVDTEGRHWKMIKPLTCGYSDSRT